jgi:hypothetical protein
MRPNKSPAKRVTAAAGIRIQVVAALVGAGFLYKYYQQNAPAVTGSVTQFATGAPFSGSTVVLACEGNEILTTSAKDGEFSFSVKEIRPCIKTIELLRRKGIMDFDGDGRTDNFANNFLDDL